ncbi:hypothetical protein V2J09_011661 [Rumex salicifolius]
MAKFAKQFEEQLIPEWKEAFLDYGRLKKEIKRIQILNCNTNNSPHKKKQSLKTNLLSSLRKLYQFGQKHREHGPIQVRKGDMYEAELHDELVDVEGASEFFSLLDLQLNKVNQFYKTKEKEFLERGESLKKQMEILIELKTAIEQQRASGVESNGDSSISCHMSCEETEQEQSNDHSDKTEETEQEQGNDHSDKTEETEQEQRRDSNSEDSSRTRRITKEDRSSKGLSGRVLNCRGRNVKLNIPLTNPSRTLSAITYLLREDVISQSNKWSSSGTKLHVNRTKVQQAEKMIKGAFIELFKGLNYLQTYRNLNKLAFVKVLEKFDMVTKKGVSPIYLRVVESSYFNISDKITALSDEVEDLFVKNFTNGDHKKAMKYLKLYHRKESHAITFFIGLFTGCFLALLAGYVIMAHISGIIFSLLFLHFFLYGCNIFLWRKARINFGFIFELAPTKELKYREVFLICSLSMAAIIGVLFVHLSLLAKGYSSTQVQAIPGFLLLCFLLLLISPFNILYKSTRYRFLSVIRNIALSPLYKVVMLDFFMADQLCSQVPLLRNLEYVACYYTTGSYKTQDYGYCNRTAHYRDLAYVVSFLPYYWRAMQCARRWFDEGQTSHLINLGKYVSAMLAAGAKLAYEKKQSFGYLCLVVGMSSGATMYQLYWDYVKDWGLLQSDSKNPWLRNELMISHKVVYYFSMVLNLVLRLAWLQTVLHPSFGNVDYRVMGLFLAALEVIRRGQWNFYRLENEHLNNVGKFRAVRITEKVDPASVIDLKLESEVSPAETTCSSLPLTLLK